MTRYHIRSARTGRFLTEGGGWSPHRRRAAVFPSRQIAELEKKPYPAVYIETYRSAWRRGFGALMIAFSGGFGGAGGALLMLGQLVGLSWLALGILAGFIASWLIED